MTVSVQEFTIKGTGLVTSLGTGGEEISSAIKRGESGLSRIERADGELYAYVVQDFREKELVPAKIRRRMSRVSKLAYCAAVLALEDAGVSDPSQMGLVVGTGLGELAVSREFLDGMHERGPHLASPALFQNSVHNAAASFISMGMGMGGPGITVSQGWVSGECALATGELLLAAGLCESVLVIGVEGLDPAWFEVIDTGPYRTDRGLRPFEPDSAGCVWGESAAAVVIGDADSAGGVRAKLVLDAALKGNAEQAAVRAGGRICEGCSAVMPTACGSESRDRQLESAIGKMFEQKPQIVLPQTFTGASPVSGLMFTAFASAGIMPEGPDDVLVLGLDEGAGAAAVRVQAPKEPGRKK